MTEKRRGYEAKIFLLISAAFSAYGVYFAGEYGFALSFLFFSFSFLFLFFFFFLGQRYFLTGSV